MLAKARNHIQLIGACLLGIGFVYQAATPFFLSVGSILLGLSAGIPPYRFNKKNWVAWGIIAIWLLGVLSGLWSDDLKHWGELVIRQLALLLIPLAFISGFHLNSKQWNALHFIWIGISALFLVITLFRYLLHKEIVDLALLQSGAIPIWNGTSSPFQLTAENSSKFVESGVNHIYFSIVQALAIFTSFKLFAQSKKKIWLVLGLLHLVGLHWLLARTGLLGFYFGVMVLFIYYLTQSAKPKKFIWVMALMILIPTLSYFSFDAVRNKVQNSLDDLQAVRGERDINHRSLAMRIEAWKNSVEVIKKSPMGVGLGDVEQSLKQQYEESNSPLWPENRIPPHNQYLETAMASGVLTSLLLLFILMGSVVFYFKNRKPLGIAVYSCIAIALCFESLLQTQLGICLFPFMLLINVQDESSHLKSTIL